MNSPSPASSEASADRKSTAAQRLEAYNIRAFGDRTAWQGLRYLSIYRLAVAALLAGLFLTPLLEDTLSAQALRTARLVTLTVILLAPAFFLFARGVQRRPGLQAAAGLALDLWTTLTILRATGGIASELGNLLIGGTLLAGVIFPLRLALSYAAAATLTILYQSVITVLRDAADPSIIAPSGVLGAAFFATALLGYYLANRVRESQAIARQRGLELANLTEINDLIIQRMNSGIMLVDSRNNAHLLNDSAWYLAGMPKQRSGSVEELATPLRQCLTEWRESGVQSTEPIQMAGGVPAIVPRFAELSNAPNSEVLVFMEDTRWTAKQAQELTLASLGRLSAAIAHEIRNPLAAISHSAQLLRESEQLEEDDERLASIIERHCIRLDDIVENVLNLARQERAVPAVISLGSWLDTFVADFHRYHDIGEDVIALLPDGQHQHAVAQIDPGHLQQVMWNLIQNAQKYGRDEQSHCRVDIHYGGERDQSAWIEVCDHGSGIDPEHQPRIFEPFFRPHKEGTGLGLYLCQQLLEANRAHISYRQASGGGACFRLDLACDALPSR